MFKFGIDLDILETTWFGVSFTVTGLGLGLWLGLGLRQQQYGMGSNSMSALLIVFAYTSSFFHDNVNRNQRQYTLLMNVTFRGKLSEVRRGMSEGNISRRICPGENVSRKDVRGGNVPSKNGSKLQKFKKKQRSELNP